MKYILKTTAICFLLSGACFAQVTSSLWEVKKGTHFIVYYQNAPDNYVDKLISRAEHYYNNITAELGFTRFDNFWTWEKRCKIYLYPSLKEYQQATGQPAWSAASVKFFERTINSFLFEGNFTEIILPHEMAHLIFREFVGYKVSLPLWLDEGIACIQEGDSRKERLEIAEGLALAGLIMPMEKLNKIDVNNMLMPRVFYAEACSAVNFLLEKYGRDRFVEFSRNIRDNQDWMRALREVYRFQDLSEMNNEWVEYIISK